MNTKRHDKDLCGPCKKSQLARSLSREQRSIGEKKPFMRDRNSDGPCEGRSERKVTSSLSLFRRRRLSPPHPRPFPGLTTMAITSRQKLNTQNIGENPGILLRPVSGVRCRGTGRAPLNISLGSNLSCAWSPCNLVTRPNGHISRSRS
jgi:hypothetical protein